ncbi:alpha/beta hydrolase family protein [Flavobacterium acetivorans]|uniref:alpha/beta hydrolase family protein n=1 Tax=Flavobacterium acetivorans TaxID=2893883 RepID=UPI001E392228|nr:prolyl oligopeptidase family serine peptidase [Flavobacterium sp. F-29]UFH36532.1 prolyl oligopeptidase family serine peptidase [Flavobacterium sp. F-29]
MGQIKEKKQLTAADYALWAKLGPQELSDNGQWVSYNLSYESHQDTLFVRDTHTLKTYALAKGKNGKFSKDDFFTYFAAPDTLNVLDLKKDKVKIFSHVKDYLFANDDRFLILTIDYQKERKIVICKTNGQILKSIDSVLSFSLNPDKTIMGIVTKSKKGIVAELVFMQEHFRHLKMVESQDENFEKITWSKKAKALSFYGISMTDPIPNITLYHYTIDQKKLAVFDSSRADFPKAMQLSNDIAPLTLSDDGNRVFMKVSKNEAVLTVTDTAMVWNTTDPLLYPERKQMKNTIFYSVWWPKSNRYLQITDAALSRMMLNGNQSVALLFDSETHHPQFKDNKDVTSWLLDLDTGHKQLFLKKHPSLDNPILASPSGGYFSYFKDSNWWVYNIAQATHTNVTQNRTAFSHHPYVVQEDAQPFGLASWSTNDKSLLVYDQFDLWEITPNGSTAQRLTSGKEDNLVYRIALREQVQRIAPNYSGMTSACFNLDKNLILKVHSTDYTASGYSLWQRTKGLQSLVFEKKKMDNLITSKKGNTYVYREETFEHSPALVFKSDAKAVPKLICKSNSQQQKYLWSKAQSISYINSTGTPLLGVLFYPADYDPHKKYPMVVHIYQKQSQELHQYVNPSLHNSAGFNVRNLVAQGYFVLYPDIVYHQGQPGKSAMDCVLAAVDQSLLTASISPEHIGLIGHSFGGYETNFIISHNNRFAAAVAGAGVADLTSFYLQINGVTGKANYWRFEFQQFRMGTSLFENKQGYLNNSPILDAANVNTPLLSWSGDSDPQVHYLQTVHFFMALRRMQKPSTMLLYPNEGHALEQRKNQQHLTQHIEKWFDHYLKKEVSENLKSPPN